MTSLRVALRLSLLDPSNAQKSSMAAAQPPAASAAPRPSMAQPKERKRRRWEEAPPPRDRPRLPRRAGFFTDKDEKSKNLLRVSELVEHLAAGKRVLFVTGAGLSCASGIPPFRASRRGGQALDDGAVWSQHIDTMSTRESFLRDPLGWYQDFWLPTFAPKKMDKAPNIGHESLSSLVKLFPGATIVTQNIDGLHQKTKVAWDSGDHLVEAHGR
jgi:hypothetical protein